MSGVSTRADGASGPRPHVPSAATADSMTIVSTTPRQQQQAGSARRGANPKSSGESDRQQADMLLREFSSIALRVESDKRAFKAQQTILENATERDLLQAALYILPQQYRDITEERSTMKLCGYPLCANRIDPKAKGSGKYMLNHRTQKVLDTSELKQFCSDVCFQRSKYFEKQISETPLWMRDEKIYEKHPIHLLSDDLTPVKSDPKPEEPLARQLAPSSDFSLIRERTAEQVRPPAIRPLGSHDAIEGYQPTFGLARPSAPDPQGADPPTKPKLSQEEKRAQRAVLLSQLIKASPFTEVCAAVTVWRNDEAVRFLHGESFVPRVFESMTEQEQNEALLDYAQAANPHLSNSGANVAEPVPASDARPEQPNSGGGTNFMPLRDSVSPAAVRVRLFVTQVSKELSVLLPQFGMSFPEVQHDLVDFVKRLDLRSDNASFSVHQWKTIGVLFLKLLSFRLPRLSASMARSADTLSQLVASTGLSPEQFESLVVSFKPRMV